MISVITPVYNGEAFIEQCIQNIVEQDCSEVEHIIVDGESSDRTIEIISEYANRYTHIRWITEKDRGQSDAMNKGISLAKGEIIGFLNVDDYYQPQVLNRALAVFSELEGPYFVAANCNYIDSKDKVIGINKPRNLNLLWLLSRIFPFPCNPSAYFYHKSIHEDAGLYDTDDHYSMDLDFLLRAVQHSKTQYFDEDWGNFRVIEGTKTFLSSMQGLMDFRTKEVLIRYSKMLTIEKQVLVFLGREIVYRANYFSANPGQIFSAFSRKCRKYICLLRMW